MSRVEAKIPRLALSKAEAAEALSISVDTFERCVQPDIRGIRVGRDGSRRPRVVFPVSELEKWVEANAALLLPDLGDAG